MTALTRFFLYEVARMRPPAMIFLVAMMITMIAIIMIVMMI